MSDKKIFLWDRKRNAIDLIFQDTVNDLTNLQIAYFNNRFYILGDPLYLENYDQTDLTKWKPAEWDFGTPSFYHAIFYGNTLVADMSDSLRPRNNYRVKYSGRVSVEEFASSKDASNIYPNPSTDYITIETDNENNKIEIYDMLGVKATSVVYNTTPVNSVDTPASGGQVRIDVSGLSSGIYFVKCGSKVMKFVKM